jgi:glutathione S-transferase
MEIVLYYAPNTCALAPYVTLTEAGADFEVRPLNFRKRQNFSPEYLKINPKHKVPALVVDGKIMTENVAIHQWVHRTFPDAKILPTDPWDQLRAISLHAWCASGIHPFLSRINNPPKVCDATGASESVIKFATEGLVRELPDRRRYAGRARVLLRPLHRPGRAFLLVQPPRHSVGGGHLRLPQRRRAFQAHAGAPERQEAARLRDRSE